MCALFDTLLFELDREIVDRFKACMALFLDSGGLNGVW
jgi:hypothetical protein